MISNKIKNHVSEWDISQRLKSILKRADLHSLNDLLNIDPKGLMLHRNMGESSLLELNDYIEKHTDGKYLGCESKNPHKSKLYLSRLIKKRLEISEDKDSLLKYLKSISKSLEIIANKIEKL